MPSNQDGLNQLRYAVAVAYSAIVGEEATENLAAANFEELLTQQLNRLTGNGNTLRSALGRIDKIEDDLNRAIKGIEALPKDAFRMPVSGRNVNT